MRKKLQMSLLLFVLLISITCIQGCEISPSASESDISATILEDLEERYGKSFALDTVEFVSHTYEAICYPTDNPSMRFSCMYDEDGSFVYDNFVGEMIAKEEEAFFSECIGDGLGQVYVRCASVLLIDEGASGRFQSNTEICEYIKNGTFTIEKAYKISPIKSLFFRIYINESLGNDDFGKEYDSIEYAVNEMVMKYQNLYKLDIYLDMDIYFLGASDFESVVNFYEDYEGDLSDLILNHNPLSMQMGIPKKQVTEDLWLTREEYIEKRKEINR